MIDHRTFVKACLQVSSERFVPVIEDSQNWLFFFVLYHWWRAPLEEEHPHPYTLDTA